MRFHYLSFFIAALVALVAKAAERKSILYPIDTCALDFFDNLLMHGFSRVH